MARAKKPPKYFFLLLARVEAIENRLQDFSGAAEALSGFLSKEIRATVEAEVDDLLSDLRIER